MQPLMLILRILHIGFGAFWVGVDVFFSFVLIPQLNKLGKEVERPAMQALMRAMPPILMVSSLVTALSGVILTGILRNWNFGSLLSSGWGIAILVGFIGTLLALIVGFGLIPPESIRLERLIRSLEGRKPTEAEAGQLDALSAKAHRLSRFNTMVLIVVVIAMAVARYV